MSYIHNVLQTSEDWERLRKGKATASQFHRIVTPGKLQFAKGAKTYAIELAAQRLGIESPEPMPTMWMEHGLTAEPYAKAEFTQITGLPVADVGFVTLTKDSQCGCSPDGFVGQDALIQVKCPKPETLIKYHIDGFLPDEYRLQVQGELWVTERLVSHFFAWHPLIEPFRVTVHRDPIVMVALDKAIPDFLDMVDRFTDKIQSRECPDGLEQLVKARESAWSEFDIASLPSEDLPEF